MFALMPTHCDHFKCRRWNISFMVDFAPLNKQIKVLKFQIHNPVRTTVVTITYDAPNSVNWST